MLLDGDTYDLFTKRREAREKAERVANMMNDDNVTVIWMGRLGY